MGDLKSWFFIEFSYPDDIDLEDLEVKGILDDVGFKYKYSVDNIIVISIENKPNQEGLLNFETEIKRLVEEKWNISNQVDETDKVDETDEVDEIVSFNYYEAEEIIFKFFIDDNSIDEERFHVSLLSIVDGKVEEYGKEADFINEIDYADDYYIENLLFHNIRCSNLAIFKLKTLSFGLAIVGYMKINNGLQVTVKTFNYDMLNYILQNVKNSPWVEKIKWKNNLKWQWLLSRKFSTGYRISHRHLVENELMKNFLKITKASNPDLEVLNIELLKRLLDKGYLNQKEYDAISEKKEGKKLINI
ncbi:hypothetical protein [Bacillus cereus]|uniref:hypothetical protein n=1 Tax=Bacillus cereus TaxID=1396 RepID=UPI00124C4BDE|nr:hypothetical protein [Bacillus cereus]KAB2481419.1 hypothetical protein F8159_08520 [Bacillus cereus]